MSEWTGRSRGNVLGYRIFIFILRHIHIRVAYFLVCFVALYFYLFSDKNYIRFFLNKLLKSGFLHTEINIYKNFLTFGKIIIDRVCILGGFKQHFTYDFEGEQHLHAMAETGKGGIIIGAHAGNWEIAGFLLKRLKHPVYIVMYDGEHSNIKELMDEITGHTHMKIIYIKDDDLSHVYRIREVLEQGSIIAMHGDRYIAGSKTHDCTFLGEPAAFPLGPYYLASRFNVPVSFVSTMKETNTHYHFYATSPMYVDKTGVSEIKKMSELYAAELERVVRKYPLQWFNYYNFWKTNETYHD